MQPLFDIDKLDSINGTKKLQLQCEECDKIFELEARFIRNKIKRGFKNPSSFCSKKCKSKNQITQADSNCGNCGKEIKVRKSDIKKSKSGHNFCSRSCAATYNNTHKTTGTRRSKFEVWIEEQIAKDYPDLNVLYNGKETINSELDIYFPDIKLAIELNGIFHYEPIFGKEKLASIENNDERKFQACLENNIELCIIDVSQMKRFKPAKADEYYKIVKKIINTKI